MTDTAIILVGGRGTRLGALTDQTPKPLLKVAGKPFLLHVLNYLGREQIKQVILATGYLAEAFEAQLGSTYGNIAIEYSHESSPLGTGGAIALALTKTGARDAIVLNGDTYFPVSIAALSAIHATEEAALSMVLRQVDDVSRYGKIALEHHRVAAMHEKGGSGPGLINGGIYLVNRRSLLADTPATAFSLERELLPRWIAEGRVAGALADEYFIDIGVPEDLQRAYNELA